MEGTLDASFVWLRDSYLEGLRQNAAIELEAACKDGLLESVLSSRQAQQAATQEALRSKAADALTIALQDGSLESALSSRATKGKEENQGSDSLEALRCKVACRLESALNDGSLQAALRDGLNRRQQTKKQDLDRVPSSETKLSQPQQSSGEDVDELRRKAAKLLAASCANGAIEAALSSQAEKKQEALRHEVAKRLENACEDGTLEAAIRSVAEANVEAVRKKIAFRMEQSASDGSLSAALAATGSRSIAGATVGSMSAQSLGNLDDSDELRNKVGQQLSEAFLDGSLEAALEASTESGNQADTATAATAATATGDLDNLKSILADSLSTAFVDGSLEAALEATKEPREKCIEPIEPYDYEAVLLLVESIEYILNIVESCWVVGRWCVNTWNTSDWITTSQGNPNSFQRLNWFDWASCVQVPSHTTQFWLLVDVSMPGVCTAIASAYSSWHSQLSNAFTCLHS